MPTPPRDIRVVPALNGYILQVGCQAVVIEGGPEKLTSELNRYLKDPSAVEKEYLSRAVNNTHPVNTADSGPEMARPRALDEVGGTAGFRPGR